MGIETELSEEELFNIKVNELSDVFVKTYMDAAINTKPNSHETIQEKWLNLSQNTERYSYLVYLEKYSKGDKLIIPSIRKYVAKFMRMEAAEEYGYVQAEFFSEMMKVNKVKYSFMALGVFSMFVPAMIIPAIVFGGLYFGKKQRMIEYARKAELNMAFREIAAEEIEEFEDDYFEAALNKARVNIEEINNRKPRVF